MNANIPGGTSKDFGLIMFLIMAFAVAVLAFVLIRYHDVLAATVNVLLAVVAGIIVVGMLYMVLTRLRRRTVPGSTS